MMNQLVDHYLIKILVELIVHHILFFRKSVVISFIQK